jgi:hypothetical protein
MAWAFLVIAVIGLLVLAAIANHLQKISETLSQMHGFARRTYERAVEEMARDN